ncbi:MAG: nucleotidyltransferase domain-containing protein [Chloroflexi bacterium]|nr:nucleotidyltransferase domain-containing protein [Chloroflexota bacterium]
MAEATSLKFTEYLPAIRRRWRQEQAAWRRRRAAALQKARQAAQILRERFTARRVIAFGSVVRDGRFDERSDIDLAVEGLPRAHYLKAWAAILRESEFEIDLIDLEHCPPSFRERIEREGMPL